MRRTTGFEEGQVIYGLSTETKPTDSSVDVGAIFVEYNTGKRWVYVDADTWAEDLTLIYALSQVIS